MLDILVQSRRDGAAAKRFFMRLLKGLQYTPRVLITDKLKSYGVAKGEVLPDIEHRESRYLNNRAENSHRPTRQRERQMQRFKSMRQAQRSYPLTLSSLGTSARAPSHDSQPVPCHACESLEELDTGDVRPKRLMAAPAAHSA